VVVHWRERDHALDPVAESWREGPVATLAQVLLVSERELAIACVDSAIRSGRVSTVEVAMLFSRLPARVQRWHPLVNGREDSGIETIVRLWLIDRGIPFVFHPVIPAVGEYDFLIGSSLLIETDGRKFHDGVASLNRDHSRDNETSISGNIVVRLSYPMVMFDWPGCERRILEHLSRRDHLRVIR
jgi:hypothetical protein